MLIYTIYLLHVGGNLLVIKKNAFIDTFNFTHSSINAELEPIAQTFFLKIVDS